jgi:hypothetical protein
MLNSGTIHSPPTKTFLQCLHKRLCVIERLSSTGPCLTITVLLRGKVNEGGKEIKPSGPISIGRKQGHLPCYSCEICHVLTRVRPLTIWACPQEVRSKDLLCDERPKHMAVGDNGATESNDCGFKESIGWRSDGWISKWLDTSIIKKIQVMSNHVSSASGQTRQAIPIRLLGSSQEKV